MGSDASPALCLALAPTSSGEASASARGEEQPLPAPPAGAGHLRAPSSGGYLTQTLGPGPDRQIRLSAGGDTAACI